MIVDLLQMFGFINAPHEYENCYSSFGISQIRAIVVAAKAQQVGWVGGRQCPTDSRVDISGTTSEKTLIEL